MSMRTREAIHVDVVNRPEVEIARGCDEERAPVDSAAEGSGFTNDATATVWDVFSGLDDFVSDTGDFLGKLDSDARLRSSANLRTLSRIRGELERIPETAAMGDPVELRLQDVAIVMDQLMRRMR